MKYSRATFSYEANLIQTGMGVSAALYILDTNEPPEDCYSSNEEYLKAVQIHKERRDTLISVLVGITEELETLVEAIPSLEDN